MTHRKFDDYLPTLVIALGVIAGLVFSATVVFSAIAERMGY